MYEQNPSKQNRAAKNVDSTISGVELRLSTANDLYEERVIEKMK